MFLMLALTLPSPPRRGFCGIQPWAREKLRVLLQISSFLEGGGGPVCHRFGPRNFHGVRSAEAVDEADALGKVGMAVYANARAA